MALHIAPLSSAVQGRHGKEVRRLTLLVPHQTAAAASTASATTAAQTVDSDPIGGSGSGLWLAIQGRLSSIPKSACERVPQQGVCVNVRPMPSWFTVCPGYPDHGYAQNPLMLIMERRGRLGFMIMTCHKGDKGGLSRWEGNADEGDTLEERRRSS